MKGFFLKCSVVKILFFSFSVLNLSSNTESNMKNILHIMIKKYLLIAATAFLTLPACNNNCQNDKSAISLGYRDGEPKQPGHRPFDEVINFF